MTITNLNAEFNYIINRSSTAIAVLHFEHNPILMGCNHTFN